MLTSNLVVIIFSTPSSSNDTNSIYFVPSYRKSDTFLSGKVIVGTKSPSSLIIIDCKMKNALADNFCSGYNVMGWLRNIFNPLSTVLLHWKKKFKWVYNISKFCVHHIITWRIKRFSIFSWKSSEQSSKLILIQKRLSWTRNFSFTKKKLLVR